jgi:mannose/fructose/N-acetylgalactosamine-specific phosphotransferase system component IID
MKKISRLDLFRLYLRSFFVQAGWNYERMLALGFTWILLPLGKKLYPTPEGRKRFLNRHLQSFNTNPYLASYALGGVAKLEEVGASEEEILEFKDSLRGPLGALGDNFIWMNLGPALLILGIILASTLGAFGALGFWLLYNLHQVYLRARGVFKGYALGLNLTSDLQSTYYPKTIKWSSRMGAIFLGTFFAFKSNEIILEKFENLIIFILLVFVSIFGFRKNVNPTYVLLASLSSFLLIKWIFVLV